MTRPYIWPYGRSEEDTAPAAFDDLARERDAVRMIVADEAPPIDGCNLNCDQGRRCVCARVRPTWLERAEHRPGLGLMIGTLTLAVWALVAWVAVLVFTKG